MVWDEKLNDNNLVQVYHNNIHNVVSLTLYLGEPIFYAFVISESAVNNASKLYLSKYVSAMKAKKFEMWL